MDNETVYPWHNPSRPEEAALEARITPLSRFMAGCCTVMMVGAGLYALLAMLLVWTVPSLDPASSRAVALASFAAWICALAGLMWGLWNGRVCFAGLARGALFGRSTIVGLRNFAVGLLVYKAVPSLMLVLLAVCSQFAALHLPPKTGITMQDLGEGMFTLASLGAIVVITTVLSRAAQIVEENSGIV